MNYRKHSDNIHIILPLSILAVLTLHGNILIVPEYLRFEVFAFIYIIIGFFITYNFSIMSVIAAGFPFIFMTSMNAISDSIPDSQVQTVLIITALAISIILIVASIVLFRSDKAMYGSAILICLSGFIFYIVKKIIVYNEDTNISPAPGAASGVTLSEREACQQQCGPDSLCLAACLDKCNFSYCVEYGKRTPITVANCVEHQRKYEASALSTAPGALLCREMHKHHGKCVLCDSNICKEESSCRKTMHQNLRNKLESKESSFTDWHMTTNELHKEWNKYKI